MFIDKDSSPSCTARACRWAASYSTICEPDPSKREVADRRSPAAPPCNRFGHRVLVDFCRNTVFEQRFVAVRCALCLSNDGLVSKCITPFVRSVAYAETMVQASNRSILKGCRLVRARKLPIPPVTIVL